VSWVTLARVAVKSKGFGSVGEEDPRQICADAENPRIPAEEVLARAAIRSRSGALLEKVTELIGKRPGGLAGLIPEVLE
jgi:hypothetical protein